MMHFSSAPSRRVVHVVVLRDDPAVYVVPNLRQQVAARLVGVVRRARTAVLEARFEVRAGEIVVCEPRASHHHALHASSVRLVLDDALAGVFAHVSIVGDTIYFFFFIRHGQQRKNFTRRLFHYNFIDSDLIYY